MLKKRRTGKQAPHVHVQRYFGLWFQAAGWLPGLHLHDHSSHEAHQLCGDDYDYYRIDFQDPAHHRLGADEGSAEAHGPLRSPPLPLANRAVTHDLTSPPNNLIIPAPRDNSHTYMFVVGLTDARSGVDEIQRGGGEREKE